MAEPLKNSFGRDIPVKIGQSIASVWNGLDVDGFTKAALDGFDDLELTPRARQISNALATYLPDDRGDAIGILQDTLDAEIDGNELTGMDGFRYLPYVFFVADHGLRHFETAMDFQYELTKRFTAEFSIRAYLEQHEQATLQRLETWTTDENVHVRRLVSEGTRPRLPWASRLRQYQQDPTPVIALLERLKDDPEEYVRRSVANNLNDIAKDHPDLVVDIARRWWADGDETRQRLIRHGLRTLIKQGHPGALDVLGYHPNAPVEVTATTAPDRARIGEKVAIEATIHNPGDVDQKLLVDFVVHFVKANDATSPKVFKGREHVVPAGDTEMIRTTVSLKQHTTRTHYPGHHAVDVQCNGTMVASTGFDLAE